jgi:hypothetical protein
MGTRRSDFQKANRPESGGANKDERREKSGMLDRDKERLATDHAKKSREVPPEQKGEEEDFPHTD